MRSVFCAICAILGIAADAATPTITGVTAQQRYPWNGKVDISYTVTGDIAADAKQSAMLTSLKVTATDRDAATIYTATTLSGDGTLSAGIHSIVWDMDAQGLSFKSSNVVFNVSCETTPATYCVIDLSAGANATSYPVTYLAAPPSGGFNTATYKKTKLVLRRIEGGSFIMGENQATESHRVTLTRSFLFGMFEVTQKQYTLVMGSNPSEYSGDDRPVEKVSYNMIRGTSNGTGWPASSSVDSGSFLGRIRARTGLDFDLPTEAQWEYACRAGTTSAYNNGGNSEEDMKKVGRYSYNCTDGKGGYASDYSHVRVGSYTPNSWELYDMHGNVAEWCLDWFNSTLSFGNNPVGPSSGAKRLHRGGAYNVWEGGCTSYYRDKNLPDTTLPYLGFRLARTLAE